MAKVVAHGPVKIDGSIAFFEGKTSRNLLLEPMISHAYLLEDGEELVLFDPSGGREIAERIEAYLHRRREDKAEWKRAFLIAGHSHMDHANNFYLSDVIRAEETHIYVHEAGFRNGRVMNEPVSVIRNSVEESKKYYDFYSSLYGPYSLLLYPIVLLDKVSSSSAAGLFSRIGAVPWPLPVNGPNRPEPLKEKDSQIMEVGGVKVKSWKLGNKVILATPGHSPCSVSLLWPERRALFTSDADWLGNPIFLSSSLRDCISSLRMMSELTKAGIVELFLPGHGDVKQGGENIISHLDSRIRDLEAKRHEVLSAYRTCAEKDVHRLTKILVNRYPVFRELKRNNYPKSVVLVHNIVTVCLREEGIIP